MKSSGETVELFHNYIYIKGMSIFLFIILFIVVLFLIGLSFIASIIRGILSFFGLGRKNSNSYYNTGQQTRGPGRGQQQQYNSGHKQEAATSGWHYSPEAEQKRRKRKKIFEANEGEYVDFEEVK